METAPEIRLRGPLQDDARKHRRSLLGMGAVTIAVVDVGLVPEEISTLGIVFSQTEQKTLLILLLIVLFYFLFAFIVYALPDCFAWRVRMRVAQREQVKDSMENVERPRLANIYDTAWGGSNTRVAWIKVFSDLKVIFDVAIPLLVAGYATVRLLRFNVSLFLLLGLLAAFSSFLLGYLN